MYLTKKHECGNWERGHAVSFLQTRKSDLVCSMGGYICLTMNMHHCTEDLSVCLNSAYSFKSPPDSNLEPSLQQAGALATLRHHFPLNPHGRCLLIMDLFVLCLVVIMIKSLKTPVLFRRGRREENLPPSGWDLTAGPRAQSTYICRVQSCVWRLTKY